MGVTAHDKARTAQLRLACYCGRLDVVQELLNRGTKANSENFRGENPLHLLLRGEYDSQEDGICIAQELLERGVDVNAQSHWQHHKTPLHLAYSCGRPAFARVLLEHGAKPNAKDVYGATPLHLLLLSEHFSQEDSVCAARLLLEYGADANARDMRYRTPLHHASYNGMPAITQVLLEHGGKPNAKDRYGQTPLHLALQVEHDSEEHGISITRLLLEYGADVNVQNVYHVTPLDMSSRFQKLVIHNILLEHSANVFCK